MNSDMNEFFRCFPLMTRKLFVACLKYSCQEDDVILGHNLSLLLSLLWVITGREADWFKTC